MTEGKPKRGRPALPKGRAKGIMFSFRVTEAEKQEFELAAQRAGDASASDWARRVLLRTAVDTRIVEELMSPGGLRAR